MSRRALFFSLLMFCSFASLIQPALGVEFPTKPIEIVSVYSAGSSMDLTARVIADVAKKYFGQPVVVVDKPGAVGSIAAMDVLNSKPDGHKLLAATNLYFALTTKTQKIMFDPSHLVPVVGFMEYTDGIAVKADSPWKTLEDLLAWGRNNPGKIRWAHVGRGAKPYLCGYLLFKKAGVETTDIPYKGTPEVLAGLLGGHVEVASTPFGPALENIKAGKIRALVNYSDRRYKALPDVPSATELNFHDAGRLIPIGSLFVHKDTPAEAKKILIEGFRKATEDPEFKKGFDNIGEEFRLASPQFVEETIRASEQIGIPILKDLGLYIQRQ